MNLLDTFKDKKVVITGHTGFKGSWLSIWLLSLGAEVHGIALEPPTNPSLFKEALIESRISDNRINVKDQDKLIKLIDHVKPDYLFHLAAQPLVKQSYIDPVETWHTNVLGTVNILNTLRLINNRCIAIIITSDKCYDNREWVWGYRETDKLGGSDPYSSSKGSAEIAFKSFYSSYFNKEDSNVLIASARAGNVIGGGDWAKDRIVPDCIRSWTRNNIVSIRAPHSTRPWQHVLEPLSGYLCLAQELSKQKELNGESFNFGPSSSNNYSVIELVKKLSIVWPEQRWELIGNNNNSKEHESGLLKLNCDKAHAQLGWMPTLDFSSTIEYTGSWYYDFYSKSQETEPYNLCLHQINSYTNLSREVGNQWI
ncbi:CDP-glucose 4,6-dehydratase [Prochlorococcus marinus]|uniref:CDP-glucose 4,6-dehydratase n=1 Tax=Prochlorococcus marinus TaxID=1219 RepID=UPI0022B5A772|nr:CDP-glucose 4,6-dehydratase [Prochlorococcus marinus]